MIQQAPLSDVNVIGLSPHTPMMLGASEDDTITKLPYVEVTQHL